MRLGTQTRRCVECRRPFAHPSGPSAQCCDACCGNMCLAASRAYGRIALEHVHLGGRLELDADDNWVTPDGRVLQSSMPYGN